MLRYYPMLLPVITLLRYYVINLYYPSHNLDLHGEIFSRFFFPVTVFKIIKNHANNKINNEEVLVP